MTRWVSAVAAVALGVAAPWARAQVPGPSALPTPTDLSVESAIPRVISDAELAAVAARVRPAVFPVRVTIDLGAQLHPRYTTADGAATLVTIGDGAPTVLLTPHALVAGALEILVWIDDRWVAATTEHATPMFDLAALRVDQMPDVAALPVAARWPASGTLYVPTMGPTPPPPPSSELAPDRAGMPRPLEPIIPTSGGIQQARVSASDPALLVTALGPDLRGNDFYVRVMASQRNGYPVVGVDGTVVAVLSFPIDDRHGGTAGIPHAQIRSWVRAWDQISGASPLGWEPLERIEELDLEVGLDPD